MKPRRSRKSCKTGGRMGRHFLKRTDILSTYRNLAGANQLSIALSYLLKKNTCGQPRHLYVHLRNGLTKEKKGEDLKPSFFHGLGVQRHGLECKVCWGECFGRQGSTPKKLRLLRSIHFAHPKIHLKAGGWHLRTRCSIKVIHWKIVAYWDVHGT